MKKNKKYDFSGYATKVGLKCSDGRTIMQDAFQDNDGAQVPLVWQHLHNAPENILGHASLENRKDGVYAYCSFNDTEAGKNAKELVKHGDIKSLSIYANKLIEKGKNVIHGAICEVSLVIAGANPGAYIDNLAFSHGDGSITEAEDEAIICARELIIAHSNNPDEDYIEDDDDEDETENVDTNNLSHADKKDGDETLGDIIQSMNEKQKTAMYALITQALETANAGEAKHSNIKGEESMKRNVFDQTADVNTAGGSVLTHSQLTSIIDTAKRIGSLKESVLQHAQEYGIENIDFLFPDAKATTNSPIFLKRDTDWVADVFGAATHTPFSRIKTLLADITGEEARARGYTKGKKKVDEVIALLKRITTPTTVYKKQKLDRDDIIDITDLEIVAWLKAEMRLMLNEELSRAVLVGDGRSAASDDKISETNIRPIYSDDELYAPKFILPADTTTAKIIDSLILSRKEYKGSGNPVFFTTPDVVGDMLLLKDRNERRIYNTVTDLAAALRVSKIVEVPVLENVTRTLTEGVNTGKDAELVGIIINMKDYSIGADKGGAISMFDDFDIDYNQYKYLMETRCSGALTVPKSALIIEKLVEDNGETPGEGD